MLSSFAFFAFCWLFHCLKWPPGILLKCCLVFLSAKRLSCAFLKKMHILDKSLLCMGYNALDCKFSDNQQDTLSNVSLNENTHITRLCIDLPIKTL